MNMPKKTSAERYAAAETRVDRALEERTARRIGDIAASDATHEPGSTEEALQRILLDEIANITSDAQIDNAARALYPGRFDDISLTDVLEFSALLASEKDRRARPCL
jgi:hypothetical protein